MKKLVLVLAAVVVALVVGADASAGGSVSTFTVTPSSPMLGDSLVFSGCGWNATNPQGTQNTVLVDVQQPDATYTMIEVSVAKSGCFTTDAVPYLASQSGTYSVFAFQKYRQAFLSFTVTG